MAGSPDTKEDEDEIPNYTIQDVFRDFRGRRAGLIKALTTDVRKLYDQFDPKKDNLCLFGHPNGTWELKLPRYFNPPASPGPPEPTIGINFSRNGMLEKDWITLIAFYSDSWLLALAFYFAACSEIVKSERKKLFELINDVPTIGEIVTGKTIDIPTMFIPSQPQDHQSPNHNSRKRKLSDGQVDKTSVFIQCCLLWFFLMQSSKSGSGTKALRKSSLPTIQEQQEDICGVCGQVEGDDFWIGCDICARWYHGICEDIAPAKAEKIKRYICRNCNEYENSKGWKKY